MSCILYNKASYASLAQSATFRTLWRDLFASTYYDSPETFAGALFAFNTKAFCDHYRVESADECEDVRGASVNPRVESVFANFIKEDRARSHGPRAYAALFNLCKRIEYQCSDADDAHEQAISWHLGWAKDWAAQKIADHINETPEETHAVRAA